MLSSEILWKKSCILYTSVKDGALDDGTNLLVAMSTYFGKYADVLVAQSQEKGRNMMRYVADLAGKVMPARHPHN